jgi:hypothetical protein
LDAQLIDEWDRLESVGNPSNIPEIALEATTQREQLAKRIMNPRSSTSIWTVDPDDCLEGTDYLLLPDVDRLVLLAQIMSASSSPIPNPTAINEPGRTLQALDQLILWANSQPMTISPRKNPKSSTRKSSQKGDAKQSIIAVLSEHHRYDSSDCLNQEPITITLLANRTGLAKSTVSDFFKKHYPKQRYKGYTYHCKSISGLDAFLRLINGDVSLEKTYGRTPPNEGNRDEIDS